SRPLRRRRPGGFRRADQLPRRRYRVVSAELVRRRARPLLGAPVVAPPAPAPDFLDRAGATDVFRSLRGRGSGRSVGATPVRRSLSCGACTDWLPAGSVPARWCTPPGTLLLARAGSPSRW